jgi:hypothetical protein
MWTNHSTELGHQKQALWNRPHICFTSNSFKQVCVAQKREIKRSRPFIYRSERGADKQKILRKMLKNSANYCNLLQFTAHTAKYYKILQNTATYRKNTTKYCKILQNSKKYCEIYIILNYIF